MKIKIMEMPDELLERLAEGLRVLAHPDRLKIVEVLEKGKEVSVGDLEILISRPQSVVSQHLGRMKRAGLLTSRRDGKHVYYRIADERPVTIIDCIRKKAHKLSVERAS